MTLLDYRLEITEERDSPVMPDGGWRYVFSISIDGCDFRSELPRQYGILCDFTLNGVSGTTMSICWTTVPP
jgi:hypothetical protein